MQKTDVRARLGHQVHAEFGGGDCTPVACTRGTHNLAAVEGGQVDGGGGGGDGFGLGWRWLEVFLPLKVFKGVVAVGVVFTVVVGVVAATARQCDWRFAGFGDRGFCSQGGGGRSGSGGGEIGTGAGVGLGLGLGGRHGGEFLPRSSLHNGRGGDVVPTAQSSESAII